ncbi:MAG: hypothetical protein IT203_03690, partial [Fimbriimonadaceae bacterium]|nr:hypothetical protein [Fimbriimonadaceae bacterium]
LTTLHHMAMSGLQDVVGGGFHRYSTDQHWHLPHFEKMLYDNALLLGNYARATAMCQGQMPELEEVFDRVCSKIVGWLQREMTSPEGLFYSALDADSDGEEGKFYVWTDEEISGLLGEGAATFLRAFQVHKEGNFHDEASGILTGQNVLHPVEVIDDRFDQALQILLNARAQRVRPSLDDKALVGWNGLAIGALAEAGEIEMAERAAEAILDQEGKFGSLPRQVVRGVPKGEAYLEDYAYLADGLISLAHAKALYEAHVKAHDGGRSAGSWLDEAQRLADVMVHRFYDPAVGGFFSTCDRHEDLFGRTKPVFDQPIPSANAIAVRVLIEIGDVPRARACLENFKGWMARAPRATEALHLALLGLPGESVPESDGGVVQHQEKVVVEPTATNLKADPSGLANGSVQISIPDGQHLNTANPPARWLTPTAIQFEPPIGRAIYPEGIDDRYVGNLLIPIEIRLLNGESGADVQLTVSYQACTESECLLPEEIKFNLIVERVS